MSTVAAVSFMFARTRFVRKAESCRMPATVFGVTPTASAAPKAGTLCP